ncbi:OmpH family outer membrane protein [Leadbetterella byssophila]|jgi:outer membrane protein|uniref:Outer membrane chaperone Skp (OmpH) n=1 Tax=Leadbetterella byssophila (strain DSM 17132 / JCM 16389 / KACC 11308 / NBRC 106382 / 4M15) TaxID=649349 RepID=E4RV95_LEAB4|nr:OmpH family outer membrane protein [Leadbetterella byssophila]ADQ18833.1 outer membrane chaperone Skp (OmpH) [Leadbetterella byssophila DSM 17132]
MKKLGSLIILLMLALPGFSQKFGYIDSEYILSRMPEYKKAEETMNALTEQWTKEVSKKYEDVAQMKLKYQQEEILLTQDMRVERQKAIEKAEEDLKSYNNSIFGLNGMLFQKKKELLKPIVEQIYKTSEKIAKNHKLSFIFDKASDLSMFYADPRHDYTDFMLEELGLVNK